MDSDQDYRTLNRANWDERAGLHAGSAGYGLQRYVDDPQRLSDVVRFDRPRLGEIGGLRTIHLQCHLGTDTLSLARLGAVVTGLDFSAVALKQARALARRAGTRVDYLQADVYDAVTVAGAGAYDLVYTGIGAPWEALPGLMIRDDRDEWRLRDRPERLPCTYTLQAVKPGPG